MIVRNISAGSFAKRYGVEEGIVFDEPTIEFSYKNDDLHDPLINDYHAVALKLATWDEIDTIKKYAFQVNDFLKKTLAECGVTLVGPWAVCCLICRYMRIGLPPSTHRPW